MCAKDGRLLFRVAVELVLALIFIESYTVCAAALVAIDDHTILVTEAVECSIVAFESCN